MPPDAIEHPCHGRNPSKLIPVQVEQYFAQAGNTVGRPPRQLDGLPRLGSRQVRTVRSIDQQSAYRIPDMRQPIKQWLNIRP